MKRVGIGQQIKAYRKLLNTIQSVFSETIEIQCPKPDCLDCCYKVPIIHSRIEFTYLKKTLDLDLYAKSLGDAIIPTVFKEWIKFCNSAGLDPFSPYEHPAAMWDWAEYKILCPLYSPSYKKCLIEDSKPISCRFGRNSAPCQSNPTSLFQDPWEIATMGIDLRIRMDAIYNTVQDHEIHPEAPGHTWVDVVNTWLHTIDKGVFPEAGKFKKVPIYALFRFSQ